jgi:hypothetical protein
VQHQLRLLDEIRADEVERASKLEQEYHPPAQRHSPTSREAAEKIKSGTPTLRSRVYKFIKVCGPVTDEQIALGLGLNPSTARPRRVELVSMGLVRAAAELGKTNSGRSAMAWVVVSEDDF